MNYDIYDKSGLWELVRQKISNIRIEKGHSARNLSLELNRSTEYLNQVENGKFNPSLDFIFDFCSHFGITLLEFFDDSNSHPTAFREICTDLSRLTSEKVAQVTAIIKSLAEGK